MTFELFGHTVIAVSSTTPTEDGRCTQRFTEFRRWAAEFYAEG